jgi:hypothetical protein
VARFPRLPVILGRKGFAYLKVKAGEPSHYNSKDSSSPTTAFGFMNLGQSFHEFMQWKWVIFRKNQKYNFLWENTLAKDFF